MKKYLLAMAIVILALFTLTGCKKKKEAKAIEAFYENIEQVTSQKGSFHDAMYAKITDNAVKSAFEMDYAFVSSSDLAAYIYYGIIQLYALTPKLVSADITKDGDMYTIRDDETVAKLRFDNEIPSSSLEIIEGGKTTSLFESVKTGSGEFAYQIYCQSGDNTYVVFQFRFKDLYGNLSVDDEATARPTSIYKNASAITSDFANKGDRVYILDNNVFTFSGSLDDDPNPTKTVVGLEVIGLKTQYLKDENIDLFNKQVKVTYSDTTIINKSITSSMLSGDAPTTNTEGSHSFTLTVEGFSKEFSYSVSNTIKPITKLEIVSGLKASYNKGEVLYLSNLVIKITYNDNSTQNVNYLSTMLVGAEPDTETLGTIRFTLKINDFEKEFSFQVIEPDQTNEQKLYNSFEKFYNDLVFDFDSFHLSNIGKIFNDSTDIRNFYTNDINDNLVGPWSPLQLLYDSVFGIKAFGEGNLDLYYPNPSGNEGHTASCTYNPMTQTYSIKYWTTKPLNTYYWYESEVSFDEATDSLKADIYCGYGAGRLYRCHVEYRKLEAGGYACMMYFPEDETNDQGKYTSLLLRFNGAAGDIALNRWVESQHDQVYKLATAPLNYAKTGDVTLSINGDVFTYKDNLESSVEAFYNEFMRNASGDYQGSLESGYLEKVVSFDVDGNFDTYQFTLESSALSYVVDMMAQYQKQIYKFDTDGCVVTVSEGTNVITFTLKYDGEDDITYKLFYGLGKLSVEYTEGIAFSRVELVKVGNIYHVLKLDKDEYGDEGNYILSQAQYTDINNMVLTNDEGYTNGNISIYQTIPSDFVMNGDKMFTVNAGVYTYKQRYNITFFSDEEIPPTLTDLDGYCTLPDPQYTDFEGWYIFNDNNEFVRIGGVGTQYRFSQDTDVFAEHQR